MYNYFMKQYSKTIKTPVGKIEVGPDKTRSDSATSTIQEMRQEFVRVAKSGIISAERLKNDDSSCFTE
jgi:hypothetical protein